MSWHRVTVREGLELLVQSYPGYQFDIQRGVLHVYPKDLPGSGHDFLDITLPTFAADSNLMADNNRLRESLNRMIAPDRHAHLSRSFTRTSQQYRNFRVENVSVREILDRFLLATDDYKVWLVVYPEQGSLTRTGFRRTLSPFDFKPVPDDEQPLWGMFLWGYDPVTHFFNYDWLKGSSGPVP